LKRPEILLPVAAGLVAGSAHRQLARSLGCAPSTVTRLSARLGRHALLLQALALEDRAGRLDESIAADHFETFGSPRTMFGVLTSSAVSRGSCRAGPGAPQEDREAHGFPGPGVWLVFPAAACG
jgi:hypothetical protein